MMKCPKCRKNTLIHLTRLDPYHRGFGCIGCGTAKEYEYSCRFQEKDKPVCGKKFKLYFEGEPFKTIEQQLCEKHLMRFYSELSPSLTLHVGVIPQWRLNMEGATPEEVLKSSYKDFGMPLMSEKEWRRYYESPHEKKRMQEFQKEQNKRMLETLGSPGLARLKDGE